MKPLIHAQISVKQHGGTVEDKKESTIGTI